MDSKDTTVTRSISKSISDAKSGEMKWKKKYFKIKRQRDELINQLHKAISIGDKIGVLASDLNQILSED